MISAREGAHVWSLQVLYWGLDGSRRKPCPYPFSSIPDPRKQHLLSTGILQAGCDYEGDGFPQIRVWMMKYPPKTSQVTTVGAQFMSTILCFVVFLSALFIVCSNKASCLSINYLFSQGNIKVLIKSREQFLIPGLDSYFFGTQELWKRGIVWNLRDPVWTYMLIFFLGNLS